MNLAQCNHVGFRTCIVSPIFPYDFLSSITTKNDINPKIHLDAMFHQNYNRISLKERPIHKVVCRYYLIVQAPA